MRFSFRKQPRWVDSGPLSWSPDQPFGFEPAPSNDVSGWTDDDAAPRAAIPEPNPPRIALAPPPEPAPVTEDAAPSPPEPPAPQSEPAAQTPPAPANLNRAPSLTARHLFIGLGQGLALYLLVQARDAGIWPGSDGYLFAALSLALLFAPLIVLEGLGDIRLFALLSYSGIAAAALATLGLYHHWRIQGADQSHAGLTLAGLTALMLVIGQAWLRAWMKGGRRPTYETLFDTSWTLIARLAIWAVIAASAWAFLGSGNSLFNWLRGHGIRPSIDAGLLILPLVGLASGAAFAMTAGTSWSRRFVKRAMLACFTIALPMLVVAGAALLALAVTAPVSAGSALACAGLLLLAINASYRGDADRGAWRKTSEFLAAFLLPLLVGIAAWGLRARVLELGWTADRIVMAATIAVMMAYALGVLASALIGIGGGGWMRRMEMVNATLSLVVVAACLALSSPLADPLALAVGAQSRRLAQGTDPAAFDFAWLRARGGRFGATALADMTHSAEPEIARAAAITLSAPPGTEAPPPSQIGANITVRTPGARLPDALLAQDWQALGTQVPPCLTKPALSCDAWFLDLDRDGAREILLVFGNDARWWASVLKLRDGHWQPAIRFASPDCRGLLTALRQGRFTDADPAPGWRDLLVAGMRIPAKPVVPVDLPCPR